MGAVVLAVVFFLTVALGAALAKGVLSLVLSLIVGGQLPPMASLRTIATGLVALLR